MFDVLVGIRELTRFNTSAFKCGNPLNSPSERCLCGYSVLDDVDSFCPECGNQLKSPLKRCSCGYYRMDDITYPCLKCGHLLKNVNARCICGYSKLDDVQWRCKRCGNPITKNSSQCGNCKIIRAGYDNWKKYNPIYKLILNEQCIFEGYKHLCTKFLEEHLICSKQTANKTLFQEGIFKPKQPSRKYFNALNYYGLGAELTTDSEEM